MQEEKAKHARVQRVAILPTELLVGEPEVPSSKYYTLRYLLAATLAEGESTLHFPALSDDSEALFRGCRALGAELEWVDGQRRVLRVKGAGRPHSAGPVTIEVGNAGAVLRLLLGVGALLKDVTFTTAYPQSLGKRPNRELLEALTALGAACEGQGVEGLLPIRIRGGELRGGKVEISGARSSQYLSSLLFLAPLLADGLEIVVIDGLKSRPLVRMTLNVLKEAGIEVEHDAQMSWFSVASGQRYQPRSYVIPGDYPSAAALLSAVAVATDPGSRLRLERLRPGAEDGEALLGALEAMGANLKREGEIVMLRGGRRLRGIELDGDRLIDCIPVLVAAACFAEGESYFYNIESLHYKESDRIVDLCAELRLAGCAVTPRQDAIVVRGQPGGIEGGVRVDGHSDHRLLMALSIAGLRSHRGLILNGAQHITKSYPDFFADLQRLGARIEYPEQA